MAWMDNKQAKMIKSSIEHILHVSLYTEYTYFNIGVKIQGLQIPISQSILI